MMRDGKHLRRLLIHFAHNSCFFPFTKFFISSCDYLLQVHQSWIKRVPINYLNNVLLQWRYWQTEEYAKQWSTMAQGQWKLAGTATSSSLRSDLHEEFKYRFNPNPPRILALLHIARATATITTTSSLLPNVSHLGIPELNIYNAPNDVKLMDGVHKLNVISLCSLIYTPLPLSTT